MAARSRARSTALMLGCAAVLASVTGCLARNADSAGTKTVTVSPSISSSVPTSAGASTSPTSTATTLPPPPVNQTKISGDCDSLLPLPDVQDAIGTSLAGKTSFVVGVPERAIHRVAYLNCRYGLASSKAEPLLEIGISLYSTATYAQRRLNATVDDYVTHGAAATDIDVGGRSGVVLIGAEGKGYDAPLLVAVSGQRTVAVSLAKETGDEAFRDKAIVELAKLAIVRSGG